MSEAPVLFEEKALHSGNGIIGCIHLNAPGSFNSLSLEMVQLIQKQLDNWRDNKALCAVFMDGEGDKAFCAGGDVKSLYEGRQAQGDGIDNPHAITFFDQEYHLDYSLHTYPKPIICWGHGVVMGGGLGLMTGCSHRIVTEKSRMAMPEITIGLYPDVGASWFLNHAPGKSGLFIGLTGVNINAHDALFLGLANRFIASDKKLDVMNAVLSLSPDAFEQGQLSVLLKSFEKDSAELMPVSELKTHYEIIDTLCDFETLAEISDAIIEVCENNQSEWLKSAATTLKAGCPVTAHLVFEQLKRGKYLSLKEVFAMERKISAQCMRSSDFYEGVRALLIDKDKSPQWKHKSINDVDKAYIEKYFQ